MCSERSQQFIGKLLTFLRPRQTATDKYIFHTRGRHCGRAFLKKNFDETISPKTLYATL